MQIEKRAKDDDKKNWKMTKKMSEKGRSKMFSSLFSTFWFAAAGGLQW